jgi:hypothetical protein
MPNMPPSLDSVRLEIQRKEKKWEERKLPYYDDLGKALGQEYRESVEPLLDARSCR